MRAPIPAVAQTDDQRWRDWQNRGLEGDRRRAVAMTLIMVVIVITLGVVFSGLL